MSKIRDANFGVINIFIVFKVKTGKLSRLLILKSLLGPSMDFFFFGNFLGF